MTLSVDEELIVATFSKYILMYKTKDEAIAYLFRDMLLRHGIYSINYKNRLVVTGYFQDMMDIINPNIGNYFSSFDIDTEGKSIEIQFYADPPRKNESDFKTREEYFDYINNLDLEAKRKRINLELE